jgi:cytochrome b pre-mRNA-processing protein 3
LSVLARIFGERKGRARLRPLYEALVAEARDPAWYLEGGIPDSVTGRFHVVAAATALALLRLEGGEGKGDPALLTEIFIADMESSLRQIGIGDFVVGKQVGRLVGALGGRLGAFRSALNGEGSGDGAGEADFDEAVRRNLFPDGGESEANRAFVAKRLRGLHARLTRTSHERLLAGALA